MITNQQTNGGANSSGLNFKLLAPTAQSQTVGGESPADSRQLIIDRAVGTCPEIDALIEGQQIKCLLDTGSQISTVTESFHMKLAKKKELTDVTKLMKVTGANELDIPYIWYVEVQVEVNSRRWVLVLKWYPQYT